MGGTTEAAGHSIGLLLGTQWLTKSLHVTLSDSHNSIRSGRGDTISCHSYFTPKETEAQSSQGICSSFKLLARSQVLSPHLELYPVTLVIYALNPGEAQVKKKKAA